MPVSVSMTIFVYLDSNEHESVMTERIMGKKTTIIITAADYKLVSFWLRFLT